MYLPPRAFSFAEVKFSLKNTPKKSPSFNLMTSEIIKHLPEKIIIFLT